MERTGEEKVPLSFGATGSGRLVYAKPFVAAPKAIVGGYMDIQYRAHTQRQSSKRAIGTWRTSTNGFDQQRFVPFIYADITEHVKFASELEIEHGIRGAAMKTKSAWNLPSSTISSMNRSISGPVFCSFRSANLTCSTTRHLNDLTDRPLVSQFVIPSTMSETGAGFYGTFYPGRTSKLDYELYVTTGPCGYNADGTPRDQ